MAPIRTVGCLLAAAALAAGCSKSSTAPGVTVNPVVGSWQVAWSSLPAGSTISPTNDTLTVVQTAGGYMVSYHQFSYTAPMNQADPYSQSASGSSFAVSGSSVTWHVGDAINTGCYLALAGTVAGTTMGGTATQSGTAGCQTDTWHWTATKM